MAGGRERFFPHTLFLSPLALPTFGLPRCASGQDNRNLAVLAGGSAWMTGGTDGRAVGIVSDLCHLPRTAEWCRR